MCEKKSKIVNVSTTDFAPALAYRAAQATYTKRNYMTKQEAAAQGIDLTPVTKEVQRKASVAMAEDILSRMGDDKKDINDFVQKMFRGPLGFAAYEVEIVESGHDKAVLDYHFCPLVQAWQSLGLSDEEIAGLCDAAMVGDFVTAETAGFDLELQQSIAHGDCVCRLVYTQKKKD
jgi:hypothetical protein